MKAFFSRFVSTLLALAMMSGCHLLVRLGQEPVPPASADREGDHSMSHPGAATDQPADGDRDSAVSAEKESSPGSVDASTSAAQSTASDQAERRSALEEFRRRQLGSSTGINTDTAIKPGEGQFVYRTQLRFLEAHSSPTADDVDLNLITIPNVLAYGLRENFTLIGVVPAVLREGTLRPPGGGVINLDDQDVADMRFFGVYRFYRRDLPGETYRGALLSGIEVPTYDDTFSSESWDPFVGTVWTYQSLQWGLDLDLVWQFNTGRGLFRHDELFYNAAYTYVLLIGQTLDERFWQLNSVFELNGEYRTDGSHLLFASPGFQLALENMIVEASLQLPVIRDLKSTIEPDFVFAVGTRITW